MRTSRITATGTSDHTLNPPDATALLVTVDDAARRLSLSARSVWKQIAAGTIPVVRIGRSTRIRITDLEKFVTAGVG